MKENLDDEFSALKYIFSKEMYCVLLNLRTTWSMYELKHNMVFIEHFKLHPTPWPLLNKLKRALKVDEKILVQIVYSEDVWRYVIYSRWVGDFRYHQIWIRIKWRKVEMSCNSRNSGTRVWEPSISLILAQSKRMPNEFITIFQFPHPIKVELLLLNNILR